MEAWGSIYAVESEHVLVRMDDNGCGRCHEPGGCGGNNLTQMFCKTPRVYRVRSIPGLMVGERVCIVLADGALRRGVTRMYGFPLLALLAGAFGGTALAGETGALSGAVLGLVGAFACLRWRRRETAGNDQFEPHIKA